MANKELEQIIEKIKRTFNVYQDQEVAKLLGISRASLANHKTRNTVPYKEIISLCSKNTAKESNVSTSCDMRVT